MPKYLIETADGRRLEIEADTPETAASFGDEWAAANPRRAPITPMVGGSLEGLTPAPMTTQEMQMQRDAQRDALKGFAAGVGQAGTGIGELAPGTLGEASARATRYLESVGAPEARIAGRVAGSIAPYALGAGAASAGLQAIAKAGGNVPAFVQTLGRIGASGLSNAAGGAVAGLTAPSGIEDQSERYDAKINQAQDEALISGAVGAGLPTMALLAGRAISPITNTLTREQLRLAQEAAARGFELSPGQQTGNRFLNYIESTLRDMPGGGMSPRAGQQAQLNREALKTAGIADDLASPDVIKQGFDDLGKQFDGILQGRQIAFDQTLKSDVARVAADYMNTLPANVSPIFKSQFEDILKASNQVNAEFANNVRSRLARIERNNKKDPELVEAVRGLREAVDDAIERSLPAADADKLREIRSQYRNLSRIDDALETGSVNAEAGNIPAYALRNAVRRSGATDELDMVSRIGRTFINDPPNSGTQMRQYVSNLATLGTSGAGGGIGYSVGGPLGAAAGAIGAPILANAAYNNPLMRAYLTNQYGRAFERLPGAVSNAAGFGAGLLSR